MSTWKYFEFLRSGIPGVLPDYGLRWCHPGMASEEVVPAVRPRHQAWFDNYLKWPCRLALSSSELFHMIDQGLGWYGRFLPRGKRLVTVHDLISYLTVLGSLDLAPVPRKQLPVLRESIRQIRSADHIIASSRNTADCLIRDAGVEASRITVIHLFLGPEFAPLSGPDRTAARAKFFGGSEYAVIHVGKASAYKNRITALKAFAAVQRRLPEARMFVVHGRPDPQEEAFLAEADCGHAVRFLGPLSQADLQAFYAAADALIFPSLYEGFGWPPVEAMACGCPVVSSPCGSLAEVVGDAAVVIQDPLHEAGFADALFAVLTDKCMREGLQSRGFKNVLRFQPDVTLQETADVYRQLLN